MSVSSNLTEKDFVTSAIIVSSPTYGANMSFLASDGLVSAAARSSVASESPLMRTSFLGSMSGRMERSARPSALPSISMANTLHRRSRVRSSTMYLCGASACFCSG